MPTPLIPDYRLTIQFSLGGLSFVLFDTAAKRVADIELHQSDSLNNSDELFRVLEKDLKARDLNNHTFQSVTCLIDGRTNTLIPEAFYQPDNSHQLLNFNFAIPNNYVIGTDPLPSLQAYNLYGYPEPLHQRILTKWPQAEILHSTSVFLKSLPQSEVPTVYINVRNRDFDMAIMKDQLLFFNNFKFQTKVVFSGLIQPSSEIIDLCRRYVKDIQFVTRPQEFNIKELLAEVPFQYYYNLYKTLK